MMLLICGAPLERAIGARGLLLLYVAGTVAAAAAQWAVSPSSQVPVIGASGAISAIVGGYALLFGQSRVRVADPRLGRLLHVLWLAFAWIGLQLLVGLATRFGGGPSIAILAHIGGFLCGLALAKPLLLLRWKNA